MSGLPGSTLLPVGSTLLLDDGNYVMFTVGNADERLAPGYLAARAVSPGGAPRLQKIGCFGKTDSMQWVAVIAPAGTPLDGARSVTSPAVGDRSLAIVLLWQARRQQGFERVGAPLPT